MKRRLLNLLAALSLLLCAAVVGLWVRSYSVSDVLRGEYLVPDGLPAEEGPRDPLFRKRKIDWYVTPDSGRLFVSRYAWSHYHTFMEDLTQVQQGWRREPRPPPRFSYEKRSALRWIGVSFRAEGDYTPHTSSFWSVSVPFWLLAAPFAVLPGVRAVSWLLCRLRRRPAGVCASCGYDLRATPGRCPECGAAAPVPAAG